MNLSDKVMTQDVAKGAGMGLFEFLNRSCKDSRPDHSSIWHRSHLLLSQLSIQFAGYLAHGTATDYMHDILGVPFSFTWEIYGDAAADFHDCFRMFNPLTKDRLEEASHPPSLQH